MKFWKFDHRTYLNDILTPGAPLREFLDMLGLLMIVGLCWIGWAAS